MARRCFFSYQYQRDVWRANQVKNAWVTQGRDAVGFYDASAFEEYQRKGDDTLKRFLNSEMQGSSVVCVLIGAETESRRWVRYEIVNGFREGKGLLGVRIHQLKDNHGRVDSWGYNPLENLGYSVDTTSQIVRFTVNRNGKWEWYTDVAPIRYSEIPITLHQQTATFSSLARTYDYVDDNGRSNIGSWIESAAVGMGR